MPRSKVLEVFQHDWGQFYFTLGRGKPAQAIDQLWYTHDGEIIGYFKITTIVRNMGDNLPRLRSISGETSEWQIKLMNWVAICDPPFILSPEQLFHESFRGYRYFDFETYAKSPYARVRI
jgi:hypothetical protein